MFKDRLVRIFLFLVIVCTAAYFVNAYSRRIVRLFVSEEYNRVTRHSLYLIWMAFIYYVGYFAFSRLPERWPVLVWHILYIVVILYSIISEVLGFIIPQWGFFIHSAMAHTAFIFCSPIPYFGLMIIVRWQHQHSHKQKTIDN